MQIFTKALRYKKFKKHFEVGKLHWYVCTAFLDNIALDINYDGFSLEAYFVFLVYMDRVLSQLYFFALNKTMAALFILIFISVLECFLKFSFRFFSFIFYSRICLLL